MSTIYVDTSAAVKRVFPEAESRLLKRAIVTRGGDGSLLVTSALTRVELSRTILRRRSELIVDAADAYRAALQGIAVAPMTELVVEFARTVEPPALRTLDAIHLATAVAVGADEVWTYDERLADAAAVAGMAVHAPA